MHQGLGNERPSSLLVDPGFAIYLVAEAPPVQAHRIEFPLGSAASSAAAFDPHYRSFMAVVAVKRAWLSMMLRAGLISRPSPWQRGRLEN